MSTHGINLDGYDGYMPAWSPSSSDIANLDQACPIVESQLEGARLEALELTVEMLKRQVQALSKEAKDMRDACNDMEDWKMKFSNWGESLMGLLWGDMGMDQRASEVTVLQGWIEESPV